MFVTAKFLTVLAVIVTITAQTKNDSNTIAKHKPEYMLLKDLKVKDNRNLTGDSVNISTFPYVVSLLNKSHEPICSGILISPILVLTAAHCINDDVDSVGYFFRTPRQIIIPVSGGVQHPAYSLKRDPKRNSITHLSNDIGILYLEKDLLSHKYYLIHHVMQFPIEDPKVNESASVYGFGFGSRSTGNLRKLGMVVVNCSLHGFDSKLVCATALNAEAGVGRYCAGDSGEPLVTPDGTVVGIASLATRSCLADSVDSVNTFANINEYVPWIERVSSYYSVDYLGVGGTWCGSLFVICIAVCVCFTLE